MLYFSVSLRVTPTPPPQMNVFSKGNSNRNSFDGLHTLDQSQRGGHDHQDSIDAVNPETRTPKT